MQLRQTEEDALQKTIIAVQNCMVKTPEGDYTENYEDFVLDMTEDEFKALSSVYSKLFK